MLFVGEKSSQLFGEIMAFPTYSTEKRLSCGLQRVGLNDAVEGATATFLS